MNINASEIFGDPELNFTLYPHQASAAWWMKVIMYNVTNQATMNGGILADIMGLGKTNTTCAVIAATPVPKTLILTPSSTRYHWIETLLRHIKSNVTVCTIDGDKVYRCTLETDRDGNFDIKRTILYNRNQNITILGNFIMVANYQLAGKSDSTNAEMIRKHEWDNLFIDEGHFLRNVNSTWRNINELVRHPIYHKDGVPIRAGCRFIITGTPIQMDKNDIVNIFTFIDESFYRDHSNVGLIQYLIHNYLFRRSVIHLSNFMKRFMRFPEKEPEYNNIQIDIPDTKLSVAIASSSFEDTCGELYRNPALVSELQRDEKAFLTFIFTNIKYENIKSGKTSFTEAPELRTLISFPYLNVPNILSQIKPDFLYTGGSSKIRKVKEIINRYKTSVVIFHHYMKIAEILKISLETTHGSEYTIISINGEIEDKDRYKNLKIADRLIASGRKVILLSSTSATSEGVNYQSFNILIKIDREYNPKTEDQTESRVQRIGQDKDVFIFNIHLSPIRTSYEVIDIDGHIENIRNSKIELSKCIDEYNCAFKFKRYYITDRSLGIENECGTYFGDIFETTYKGKPGGPDSYGPDFIH